MNQNQKLIRCCFFICSWSRFNENLEIRGGIKENISFLLNFDELFKQLKLIKKVSSKKQDEQSRR